MMKRNYLITLLTVLIMLMPRTIIAEENIKQKETFNKHIMLYCNNYSSYTMSLPKYSNKNTYDILVKGKLNDNQQIKIITPNYLDLYDKTDSLNSETLVNINTSKNNFSGLELNKEYSDNNKCQINYESINNNVSIPIEIRLLEDAWWKR